MKEGGKFKVNCLNSKQLKAPCMNKQDGSEEEAELHGNIKMKANERSSRCKGCFFSHFPRPNTSMCRLDKQRKARKMGSVRLRGGANVQGNESLIEMSYFSCKVS